MDYRRLGNTGLKVSRLCLGCMGFGVPGQAMQGWVVGEDDTRAIIRRALESGINFFDTANAYGRGASEEITGRALMEFARRDEVVVATKAFFPWGKGVNQGGLSRKALLQAVDDSLRRLGTDYIDLYQIHRWDRRTPIEETLETLNDIVRAGKVRYIGASSMFAWQFQKAVMISRQNGWAHFVSMQNQLNLLYREEEREMLPLCRDEGIGVIPWSPLARGRLTRPVGEETARSMAEPVTTELHETAVEADRAVISAVQELATDRNLVMAQVAMAWVMAKPEVTAPIIGVTRMQHLEDALSALDVTLSEAEIGLLEAAYIPHPVAGHR